MDSGDVTGWVVDDFAADSSGKVVTPDSLLSDWDSIYLTIIFGDIRRDLSVRGYLLKSLTTADLSDDKKVGKTVGDLADAIYKDLVPKPVMAAARSLALATLATGSTSALIAAVGTPRRGRASSLQPVTAAYLEGYSDATQRLVNHIVRRGHATTSAGRQTSRTKAAASGKSVSQRKVRAEYLKPTRAQKKRGSKSY